jgi:hypothetical protein
MLPEILYFRAGKFVDGGHRSAKSRGAFWIAFWVGNGVGVLLGVNTAQKPRRSGDSEGEFSASLPDEDKNFLTSTSIGDIGLFWWALRSQCRGHSFAPLGLVYFSLAYPRLAPWAAFFRRYAAGQPSTAALHEQSQRQNPHSTVANCATLERATQILISRLRSIPRWSGGGWGRGLRGESSAA